MVPICTFHSKRNVTCRICPFVLLMFMASAMRPAIAQTTGVVCGVVSDSLTRQPISQVNITITIGKPPALTDSLGYFRLTLTQGTTLLSFAHIGYARKSVIVAVMPGDSVSLPITMTPVPIPLGAVTVLADSQPVSTIRSLDAKVFSTATLPHVAGVFGDVGKTLQAMTGVTANNETSGQFSVRGGTMFQNLLMLNGIEILEPYHLKEAPNTGLTIINTALLKRAIFVPGGFTARYGDCLSAVLDLDLREGDRDRLAALLDLNLAEGTASIEGPVTEWGSALLSFRSSYGDYVAHYLTEQNQRRPTFYDLTGQLSMQISEEHRLSMWGLFSSDRTRGLSDGGYTTRLVGLQGNSALSAHTTIRSSLSVSRQFEDMSRTSSSVQEGGISWSRDSSSIDLIEAKAHIDVQVSESIAVAGGVRLQGYSYEAIRRELLRIDTVDGSRLGALSTSGTKASAYVETIVGFSSRLIANAGLRWDASSLTGENVVSPRFLVSYQVRERTLLKAAWGLYYQTPTFRQLLASAQAQRPPQRMQLARHYILGIERGLEKGLWLRAEIYFKELYRLIGYDRLRTGDLVFSPINDSRGQVSGLEFEISFRDERVSGWLNVATMTAKEVGNALGARWHYSPTDQRMTINLVFEPRLAEGWLLSLRSYYGSGFAYVNDLPGTRFYTRDHYPDYKRIDVRLNYQFKTGPLHSTAFVEITNLFSTRNVRSFQGTLYDNATPDYNLLLPLIINVGLRYEY